MSLEYNAIAKRISEVQARLFDKNFEFNEYYDESSEVNSGGYRNSEVLFKCDPDGYESALIEWRQQNFEERFEPTLNLLKDSLLRDRVRPLIKAIKKSKIAPFVGAGLSIPCGKQTWAAMLEDIAARSNRIDQPLFKAFIESEDYIEAADLIAQGSEEQLIEYIKTSLSEAAPTGGVTFLPQIASECIITTNLDSILETVYRQQDKPFDDGHMYGVQENHFFHHLVSGGRCLLKIHGTCLSPATHVFTKDQYDKAYGGKEAIKFSNVLPKALRQIFITNSLLFLGCSLVQDRTLELFEQVVESKQFFIPDHYAFLETPKSQDTRDREHTLAKLKILPIWYPHGKHEHVENFMEFLAAHKNGDAPDL